MDVGKGRGKKVAKGSWNGSLSFPNRHWSPDAVVCLFNEFIAVNNFLIIRKVKIRFPDFVFDLYFNIPLTFATLIFRIMYFIGRIFFFPFFLKNLSRIRLEWQRISFSIFESDRNFFRKFLFPPFLFSTQIAKNGRMENKMGQFIFKTSIAR